MGYYTTKSQGPLPRRLHRPPVHVCVSSFAWLVSVGFVGCGASRNAAFFLRRSPLLLDRNKSHALTLSLRYRLILQFLWLCVWGTVLHLISSGDFSFPLYLSIFLPFSLSHCHILTFFLWNTDTISIHKHEQFCSSQLCSCFLLCVLILSLQMVFLALSLFFLCVVVCTLSIFCMYCVLSSPFFA